MSNRLILSLLALFAIAPSYSQSVSIYQQLNTELITATASSSFKGFPAQNAINGKGMQGDMHATHNLGQDMWLSKPSVTETRYNEQTHQGAVWFLCEIAPEGKLPRQIDQIRIWNHNQNEHTRRGLNKVYIEYSSDGKSWNLLRDGNNDFHRIPESIGRNPEPADFSLATPGLKARYICFTADATEGNHYDMQNPVIRREVEIAHQNPRFHGLSEIRFYTLEKVAASSLKQVDHITFTPSQGYLKRQEGPSREFSLQFNAPIYTGATLRFTMGAKSWSARIAPSATGISHYQGLFPAGYMDESTRMTVDLSGKNATLTKEFEVPAARKWTVCFFPHSHLDIGYTHRQNDVMKLQWRNLFHAIELAERTKNYPDGARFRWNTEATWPIAGYLEQHAGTPEAELLLNAVREGIINVDAPVGSILTGISRQEELMHMFDDAHRIAEMTGVEINTAMTSDVPGQAWGLATAMAKNGVRYFSPGPNYVPFYGKIGNDRAAALHTEWGDRPFWWQSQSSTDKVLVWQAGRGYSWFHGWLAGRLSVCGLEPIWSYLNELEGDEFPYNTCYLRYTVHGDNGPPDELMPDLIRAWNEKYDSPQFRISTTKEFFTDFEERYGDVLPTYGGDMTPTWEDGAASTAHQTAMNRQSAARLAQTETLWSMLSPEHPYPAASFDQAWKNVLLFSEHTWGASASGPDPHSQFTRDLWAGKKMFADSADLQSRSLHKKALSPLKSEGNYLHVINTNLWERTDVVTTDVDLSDKQLLGPDGKSVGVQRLHDGQWIFLAERIQPLSSTVYRIVAAPKSSKKSPATTSTMVRDNVLDNGEVRVEIDTQTGAIRSLKTAGSAFEYASGNGLNDYVYTERLAKNPRPVGKLRSIEILDNGPVAATLRILSDAPGCNLLQRDITVYKHLGRVDIRNTVDKQEILDFESIRFIFPFNFPHPDIAFDLAMSEVHPEREQLAGVNKHYYSVQNGLSIGDLEHGIVMTSIDAPFVELGTPSGEDYRLNPRHGYGWWPSAQISPVIYSWVMNNTWRTNYKASQGGLAVFRYSLEAGDPFDLQLKQRGAEREQTLLSISSSAAEPIAQFFRLKGNHRIAVSSIRPSNDGRGYIVTLQNNGKHSVNSGFVWGRIKASKVSRCDYRQQPLADIDADSFWMQPYEYLMLKLITE